MSPASKHVVLPIALILAFAITESARAAQDYDRDGHTATDCRPLDPAVHPGAVDRPDSTYEDTNCDGIDGDVANVIFVATDANGGSDSNPGSRGAPVRTLAHALSLAARQKDILVAAGTYQGSVTIPASAVSVERGLIIAGGYVPGTWARPAGSATVVAGAPQAVLVDGARKVLLQRMSLQGTGGDGLSRYGLRAVNRASVALESVSVSAEDGGSGGSGGHGAPGGGGLGGARGTAGDCDGSGGEGGPGGSGAWWGGHGGGGARARSGHPGQSGGGHYNGWDGRGALRNWGFGGAGGAEHNEPGRPGQAGGEGAWGFAGGAGAHASDTLESAGDAWASPAPNTPGGAFAGAFGGPGTGGGGGGAGGGENEWIDALDGTGSGGGGGGGGGHGGQPGRPGTSGGGSFGVYLSNAAALLVGGSDVRAGRGGSGGDGGSGGVGGPGGAGGGGGAPLPGCADEVGPGGRGGDGGHGGRGGDGGSGVGGPSFGVFGLRSIAVRIGAPLPRAAGGGNGGRGAPPGRSAGELLSGGAGEAPEFDGDGVLDGSDPCPTVPGSSVGSACPVRPAVLADRDGDTVPDAFDRCPAQPRGDKDVNEDGCPDDVDVDGDRYFAGSQDCRDDDPAINVGAAEVPRNGVDENCDGADGPFPDIPSRISIQYRAVPRGLVVRSLIVNHVLAGTTVELRCAGRSCPVRRKLRRVVRDRRKVTFVKRWLRGRRLRAGTVLDVRAVRPEMLGRVRRDRIARGSAITTLLCVEPRRVTQAVGFLDASLKPRPARPGEDCG